MPIYMQYGTVKGEVTETNHVKWVQLESFSFGVSRSLSTAVGRGMSREASAPSVHEVTISKHMDAASKDLLELALTDSNGKTVKIDFTKTGSGASPDIYLQYEFTNTLISGYAISGGGDEKPMESLSLNFTKFEEKWTQYDETNKAMSPVSIGFDLAVAKKV